MLYTCSFLQYKISPITQHKECCYKTVECTNTKAERNWCLPGSCYSNSGLENIKWLLFPCKKFVRIYNYTLNIHFKHFTSLETGNIFIGRIICNYVLKEIIFLNNLFTNLVEETKNIHILDQLRGKMQAIL